MENKINAPIEGLITFVKSGKGEIVCKILSKAKETHHIVFRGKGSTNANELIDFFGFGLRDTEVVIGLIKPENSEDLVNEIAKKLDMQISTNGIVFTVPISGASSSSLKMLDVKQGEIK